MTESRIFGQGIRLRLIVWLLSIMLLGLVIVGCKAGSGQQGAVLHFSFVQWSDIHIGDPKTRVEEWDKAFFEGLATKPEVLALTGDVLDNKTFTESEFQKATDSWLADYAPTMLRSGRPVIFSYGNNDFFKNYNTAPGNMTPVTTSYQKAFGAKYYLDALGNGVYPGRPGDMTWITINSLVFSPNNDYSGKNVQAQRTLEWLDGEIANAPSGKPIVIACHIPPTYDLYSFKAAWPTSSLSKLVNILHKAPGPVVFLSGHFHRNEQHAIRLDNGKVAVVLDAGGLARKYGYEPNWRSYDWSYSVDNQQASLAWEIKYPGNPEWNSKWSMANAFSASSWEQFVAKLSHNPTLFQKYALDFWPHAKDLADQMEDEKNRTGLLEEVFVAY